MVELDGVTFLGADQRPVLQDLSLGLAAGEKVVLLGVNGSGKTTLLKVLNGLIFPARGHYRFRGEAVDAARLRDRAFSRRFRRQVALLFQSPDTMLFNPTVRDEIAFSPRQLGAGDVEGRVDRWAGRLGVGHLLDRPPYGLSGGEKQKVCLAALLALEPELLLLDEPTANLDPRSTGLLVDLLQELPCTTLVATHNLSLAAELGDRTLVLGEDHTLVYDGPLAPFLDDRDRLLAANLVHTHRHRHGTLDHRHYHVHDWE